MVTYRAILDLPAELVSFVETVIATRRSERRSPWRKLTCFDQAVLALVWLRDGDTFAQLGRHFGISTDTAWRYAHEAVDALAGHAPGTVRGAAHGRRRTWTGSGRHADPDPSPLHQPDRIHPGPIRTRTTPASTSGPG